MTSEQIICRLFYLPDFKMENWVISAGGFSYDISNDSIDMGLLEAYLHISASIKAKEMVKNAKVVL